MADVYLSGPVLRPDTAVDTWIPSFYRDLGDLARHAGARVHYPLPDIDLDQAGPSVFYRAIENRISGSAVVVVVFTGGDVSSSIEAGMASQLGKPILLVSARPDGVPRLLRGMPLVAGPFHYEEVLNTRGEAFFREHLRRDFMTSS